jgi:hypothetical protein
MDVGIRTPFLDLFRRGEVAKDVRILAARGTLAPRAHEQLALLALLTEDPEADVRGAAEATLAMIPDAPLTGFLARSDVPDALRDFFKKRGVEPAEAAAAEADDPLIDTDTTPKAEEGTEEEGDAERQGALQRIALMNVSERMRLGMKGTKEERSILIRDPNKLVCVAVLSSPKLSESEVESFSKMASLSDEVLRLIGMNRAWTKNYGVISALTKNPKTPLAVSLNLVQRLIDKDLKMIALDRNIQEPLKIAVRKRLAGGKPGS